MSGPVLVVQIDDSSNKIIIGAIQYDRANGGRLVVPAGNAFPAVGVLPGEFFLRSDEQRIYRRNDANSAWEVFSDGTLGAAPVDSVNGQVGVVVLTAADVGAVDVARVLTAGHSLSGGGDLSADRTFDLDVETIRVSDSVGGLVVPPGGVNPTFDTAVYNVNNSGSYTFTPGDAFVTVVETGFYEIRYTAAIDKTSGGFFSRDQSLAGPSIGGGAPTADEIDVGLHLSPASGVAVLGKTIKRQLSAGQTVGQRLQQVIGGSNLITIGGTVVLEIARLG